MESEVAVDALRADLKVEGDALLADYVQRYRRLIERLCRILLADSGDAEDATQQTFLLAYQSLLSGTRPHHPRAWLCTIARRECWARDHRRRRERAVAQPETRAEPDPAERTVLRAELATISAGLEQLPTRQRQAIVLREMAGMSYTQLAAALEVSESAAEALLVRARRNLRDARLGLVLLWPFPHRLRRLVQTGFGHARNGLGVSAAKAAAVVTIVTASTAVAGSAAPFERAAIPAPNAVTRAAPARPPVKKAAQRPVVKRRPAAQLVRRRASAHPAVSSAPVRRSLPAAASQDAATGSAGVPTPRVSPAPAPPAVRAAAPKAQPRAPKASTPRPPVTKHPKPSRPAPAPKAATSAPPAPTTTEPDPAAVPPPAAETTETPPPATPDDPAGSGSGVGSPDGDTRPGNGLGDDQHDHTGKKKH